MGAATTVTGSSNKITFSGGGSSGSITLSGATVSGSGVINGNAASANVTIAGSGNKITFSGGLSSGFVTLTKTPASYSCPLGGAYACGGSPVSCTAPKACTPVYSCSQAGYTYASGACTASASCSLGGVLNTASDQCEKTAKTKEVYFYHTDPAGTPVAMTNDTGAVVWKADYKPFGEEYSVQDTKPNNRMFIGKEKDAETGLYYFGARYMQDRTARFISVDPVGPVDEKTGKVNEEILINPQRINRYVYSLNNPYKYSDPDGKFAFLVAPLAIPALEALGYSVLGLTTFKVLEQAYKNYKEGMYNEGTQGQSEESTDKTGTYAPDRPLPRDQRTGKPIPESDNPHTQLGQKTSKKTGKKYTQGREFGEKGEHVRDVDFSDHGRPQDHPNPHQHRINPDTGKRGGPEPLP